MNSGEWIAQLIFGLIICALVALIGKNRKIGYGMSLVACMFLTPVIGLIIILLGLNLLFSEFFHFNIFTSPVWKAFCALLIIFIGVKIIENGRK